MNWSLIISNALYTAIGVNAIGYGLAALGLNVHFGYTGLLNFGQAGFAAIGAYSIAVPVRTYGWNFLTAIPVLFLMAAVFAVLLGVPTLRLRSDYLAIVTIAAAEIIRLVLTSPRLTGTLGGADGLNSFTGDLVRWNPIGAHTFRLWKQPFTEYDMFIIIAGWTLLIVCSVIVYLLMRSPWGRVLKSIREDQDAARSLGKNVFNYKMTSLVIGGVIGALGGMILAIGNRSANPITFRTDLTFFCYTILVLGGVGKVKGPIIGAVIFWFVIAFTESFLKEATAENRIPNWLANDNNYGFYRFMFVGFSLILLVIFRPQGIFGDKREQAFDVR